MEWRFAIEGERALTRIMTRSLAGTSTQLFCIRLNSEATNLYQYLSSDGVKIVSVLEYGIVMG